MRRPLTIAVATALLGALFVPGQRPAFADPTSQLSRTELAGAWIAREAADGSVPGPTTRTDWGLTIDALFALYATGVGESAARRMTSKIESHAGAYLGPDLYRDEDVRLAGSAAALLNVAVVTDNDPTSFGHGRYAGAGNAYDMRAEVLDLIAPPRAKQPGRLRDRGTGSDSTNTFSQSLAVIGLARSGGGHEPAVAFLRTQQCRGGYFRMFYNDGESCNEARGRPDIDGTSIATQALIAARAAGTDGLDRAIDRASRWLRRIQRPDGSFGGAGSSEPPNANTTGLAAQTLHATGATAPYRKARTWVSALQVTPQRAAGTAIASDVGAFAYDRDALADGKRSGIDDSGRDQWRRASVQAVFAIAPVPYGRLGARTPTGNPRVPDVTEDDPDDQTGPPGNDDDNGGDEQDPPDKDGSPHRDDPPAEDPTPRSDDSEDDTTESGQSTGDADESDSPSERAAAFIADRLVDDTHIEVRERGTRYVDYDATADAAIALRLLGERPMTATSVTKFLLRDRSIDAYVHGKPYEQQDAAYAEPLAKLSFIAQWMPSAKAATALADQLAALQNADGGFDDAGEQADQSMRTRRQAWAALALRAAGRDAEADRALRPIVAVQCDDGSFAIDLTQTDCATGDTAATGLAVQAINASHTGDSSAGSYATAAATAAASPDRVELLRAAAGYLTSYGSTPGAITASTTSSFDWPAVGAIAAGRQALGHDATYIADRVGRLLRSDGGLPGKRHSDLRATIAAAPAIAGRSLLGAMGSPVVPESHTAVDVDSPRPAAAPADDEDPIVASWVVYGLAGLLALVLLLAAVLLTQRIIRRPEGRSA